MIVGEKIDSVYGDRASLHVSGIYPLDNNRRSQSSTVVAPGFLTVVNDVHRLESVLRDRLPCNALTAVLQKCIRPGLTG